MSERNGPGTLSAYAHGTPLYLPNYKTRVCVALSWTHFTDDMTKEQIPGNSPYKWSASKLYIVCIPIARWAEAAVLFMVRDQTWRL